MKKILFVIDSLTLGGAEKSLVTLLNLMDYSRYDVDLLLFSQGGAFQALLPKEVKLLPVPEYFAYNAVPWSDLPEKIKHPRMLLSQLRYSAALRMGKHNHIEKAVLLWESCRNCFREMEQVYDTAIAYAQGVPTFFVAEKVQAKKKAAWINAIYIPTGRYLSYIQPFYKKFDTVNAVSESVAGQMQATFGIPDEKVMVMKDILDAEFAVKMANMPSEVSRDMAGSGTKILTVGRLASMKGYDLAIGAAKILRDQGFPFTWYAIGDGALRGELERQIGEAGLQDSFVLLGSRVNPYPYFAACDLYVQPSRFEGFGITLAEAKMFHKPIVTTNFDAVGAQFENEKNGLIVDISPQTIADGILRMERDEDLRRRCVANVRAEKKGNPEEIEKLYAMIENVLPSRRGDN